MLPDAARGKRQIVLVAAIQLFTSLNMMVIYSSSHLDDKLATRLIRFFLSCGLLYGVYTGVNWARVLMGLLLAIGALGACLGIFGLPLFSEDFYAMLIMSVVYGFAGYILLFSKDIQNYYMSLKAKEVVSDSED